MSRERDPISQKVTSTPPATTPTFTAPLPSATTDAPAASPPTTALKKATPKMAPLLAPVPVTPTVAALVSPAAAGMLPLRRHVSSETQPKLTHYYEPHEPRITPKEIIRSDSLPGNLYHKQMLPRTLSQADRQNQLCEMVEEIHSESRSVGATPSPSHEIVSRETKNVAEGYDGRYEGGVKAKYQRRFKKSLLPVPVSEIDAMNTEAGKILALKFRKAVTGFVDFIASTEITDSERVALIHAIDAVLEGSIAKPLRSFDISSFGEILIQAINKKYLSVPEKLKLFLDALKSQMGGNYPAKLDKALEEEPDTIVISDYGCGSGIRFLHYYLSLAAKGINVRLHASDISTTALAEFARFIVDSGSFESQVSEYADYIYWGLKDSRNPYEIVDRMEQPWHLKQAASSTDMRLKQVRLMAAINAMLTEKSGKPGTLVYPRTLEELEGPFSFQCDKLYEEINSLTDNNRSALAAAVQKMLGADISDKELLSRKIQQEFSGNTPFRSFITALQKEMKSDYPLSTQESQLAAFKQALAGVIEEFYSNTVLPPEKKVPEFLKALQARMGKNYPLDPQFKSLPPFQKQKDENNTNRLIFNSDNLSIELAAIDPNAKPEEIFEGFHEKYVDLRLSMFGVLSHMLSRKMRDGILEQFQKYTRYAIIATLPESGKSNFLPHLERFDRMRKELSDHKDGLHVLTEERLRELKEERRHARHSGQIYYIPGALETQVAEFCEYLSLGFQHQEEVMMNAMKEVLNKKLIAIEQSLKKKESHEILTGKLISLVDAFTAECCDQLASLRLGKTKKEIHDIIQEKLGEELGTTSNSLKNAKDNTSWAANAAEWEDITSKKIANVVVLQLVPSHNGEVAKAFNKILGRGLALTDESFSAEQSAKTIPLLVNGIRARYCEKTPGSELYREKREAFKLCLIDLKSQLSNRSLVRAFEERKETPYHLYTWKEASEVIKDQGGKWKSRVTIDTVRNPENICDGLSAGVDLLDAFMLNIATLLSNNPGRIQKNRMPNYMLVISEVPMLQDRALAMEGERLMKDLKPHALFTITR